MCLKIIKRNMLRSTGFSLIKRFSSSLNEASQLSYSEFGEPIKVVHKECVKVPTADNNNVLVKMIAAPINPADINTIQGKYPVKPTFPAVPGNEGLGEIVSVGNEVSDLKIGDRIIPVVNNLGTWRTHAVFNANHVLKVPNDLGVVEASTLTVNPCTAYRMLKDFEHLEPGDTVIQNGANSACGQNVIQLCKAWSIKTVNIVRPRENLKELITFLKELGATEVLTEEQLRTTELFKSKKLNYPKLALNCVGGRNALEVLRHIKSGGTMVTYGGMSREPVTIPTSTLIFKDIKVKGFWMTRWNLENAKSQERTEMFNDLINLMLNGSLKGPSFQMVPFENYKDALINTMTVKGMVGKKYILKF